MKYLVLAVMMSVLACTAVRADSQNPQPAIRWGVGRASARAAVGYPSIPPHECIYESKVVEGWEGVQADPLFDKLDAQMDRLYAQQHGGKRLGGADEGHTGAVNFTIVRKTRHITSIKVDEELSTDPAFSAETVNMLRKVRLSRTWSPKGPEVIDVCYTIYSGKSVTGSTAGGKQPAIDTAKDL